MSPSWAGRSTRTSRPREHAPGTRSQVPSTGQERHGQSRLNIYSSCPLSHTPPAPCLLPLSGFGAREGAPRGLHTNYNEAQCLLFGAFPLPARPEKLSSQLRGSNKRIKRSSSCFLIPRCSNSRARSRTFLFFPPPILCSRVTGVRSCGRSRLKHEESQITRISSAALMLKDSSPFKTFSRSETGGTTDRLALGGGQMLVVLLLQMRMSACRRQKTQTFPRGPPGMWLPKK